MRHLKTFFSLALVLTFLQMPLYVKAQDIGDKLPPLHVTDWINGSAEQFGKWGDGKVYLLEFWGTWCPPCLKIMPDLTKMQREYADKDLVIIGYSWESPEILRKFVAKHRDKIGYAIVSDTEKKTVDKLIENGAIQGFPYAFLVGRDGKIVWKGNSKYAHRAVRSYLAGKPVATEEDLDF